MDRDIIIIVVSDMIGDEGKIVYESVEYPI